MIPRSKIAGMVKYGTMKDALRSIREDTSKHHDKFVKEFRESLDGSRNKPTPKAETGSVRSRSR